MKWVHWNLSEFIGLTKQDLMRITRFNDPINKDE